MFIRLTKSLALTMLLVLFNRNLYASDFKHELLDQNDGFLSSIVFSIEQDEHGFLWFGTAYDGIMRYDGKNVVSYINEPSNPNSLPHNNAGNLFISANGNLWIGSWGGGVARLNLSTQKFEHFPPSLDNENSISARLIQTLFEDAAGKIWFGSYNRGVSHYNKQNNVFTTLPFSSGYAKNINNTTLSSNRVWDIAQLDNNGIWLGTNNGLNYLNTQDNTFTHYYPQPESQLEESNRIRRIQVVDKDTLFLGTQNGILSFDISTKTFKALPVEGPDFLGPIYSIIKTTFGEYWVSTDFGVYSFSNERLVLSKVDLNFDDSCSQTLFQDRQETIWLSCEGVGIYKLTKSSIFSTFNHPEVSYSFVLHESNDNAILVGTSQNGLKKWIPETNDIISLSKKGDALESIDIRFLTQTSDGVIWFANNQRVFYLDDSDDTVEFFTSTDDKRILESIRDFEIDALDRIWIAVPTGIFRIDTRTKNYTYYSTSTLVPNTEDNLGPIRMLVDNNDDIWALVENQFLRYNKNSDSFTQLIYEESEAEKANEFNFAFAAFHDSKGEYWIANRLGLYKSDMKTGERELVSTYFNERENRGIRYITEDNDANLWLISAVDVSRFNIETGELVHFDSRDGLPDTRLYDDPTRRQTDGSIYLSSRDGIFYFNPKQVPSVATDQITRLTRFEVLGLNKKFNVNELMSNGIDLAHDQSNIKFDFATLDLLNARQISYQYKLDGFDPDWIDTGIANAATYTNLSGAEYMFRVRSRLKENQWYQNELAIRVNVEIPIWQQWWMYGVYVMLVLMLIALYLYRQKQALIKLEQQVADKTAGIAQESKKLAAANRIKTQFLANMSHEIRTPLTTVIGQAEAIICRDINPDDIYKEVEIIHDSSIYLLTLLNDILDLTKIEENKFELEYSAQDLHSLLANINTMFSMQARVKGLTFRMEQDLQQPFVVNIDGLRLKQILVNLLSNAIKFTLQGYVTLQVEIVEKSLMFHVQDTGIGIDDEQLAQIFDSFTQGDASIRRRFGGSGLGLHLSNQLAVLMKGKIDVQSELDKGSRFTFSMPLPELMPSTDLPSHNDDVNASSTQALFEGKILLAEDHEDNRRLISRLLTKLGLDVYTAKDGFQAIEQYKAHQPQVILLDIQMPIMDGIQAFKALRKLGCNRPIIALTANAMPNEVEEYFALGFDGYIQKPIDRESLVTTIATFYESTAGDAMSKASTTLHKVDMSDLVEQFTQSLAKEWELFDALLNASDIDAIRAQAHKIAGAAQLFGLTELSTSTTHVENKIKNGCTDITIIKKDLQTVRTIMLRGIK